MDVVYARHTLTADVCDGLPAPDRPARPRAFSLELAVLLELYSFIDLPPAQTTFITYVHP